MKKPSLLLVCVALLAGAAPALAQTGITVKPAAPAPENARTLGPLCRMDTPAFRLWWSDTPGSPGAVGESDGSCATVPTVVGELAQTAEAARVRAVSMGFPAMVGDGPPPYLVSPGLLRQLVRLAPRARARALGGLARKARGSFLAGLTGKQRVKVLKRLPKKVRATLKVDVARAVKGVPANFVGGDRRTDIVIDATGATGQVQRLQPGLSPCRARVKGRTRTFVASWAVVYAPPGAASPRDVLAHELFHVVQCNVGSGTGTPILVREGTAEWFNALAEPAAFPGPIGAGATGGTSISNGNARAAGFCNAFDPAGPGTAPYASWAVWEALDTPAARSGTVLPILKRFPGTVPVAPDSAAVIAAIGQQRWVDALRTAAREVCGNFRTPSGTSALAPQIRDFLGAGTPTATTTAPGTVNLAAGGIGTIRAVWSTTTGTVTVRISSPQAPPEALLPSTVSTTKAAGLMTAVVRDGVVVLDIPAAAVGERNLPVTLTNPALTGPVAVTVQVTATPSASP